MTQDGEFVKKVLKTHLWCFVVLMLCLAFCRQQTLAAQSPEIYVHYMPWYQAKPFGESWGYHWTMNKFKPEKITNGKREIASQHYPLIGPYDSNDPDVLAYHLQTIKLTGIDGLIIDWYGIEDYYDYAMIHRNTQHLVQHIKKAGLKFMICYEDQIYKHLTDSDQLEPNQALPSALNTFEWMEEHWFADPAYARLGQSPVLLVFGPQYFEKQQWENILGSLKNTPKLYSLPQFRQAINADGCFTWPPVSGGKTIPDFNWRGDLEHVYLSGHPHVIPLAFPGYHDIYAEAGQKSFGYIDHKGGRTLQFSLNSAFKYARDFIQIATWNDFGEGTVIEPTREFGFQYLEMIQQKIKTMQPYKELEPCNLELPHQLYQVKQTRLDRKSNFVALNKLDALLYSQKFEDFKRAIKKLE